MEQVEKLVQNQFMIGVLRNMLKSHLFCFSNKPAQNYDLSKTSKNIVPQLAKINPFQIKLGT